jgi:hypothetical protein
MARPNSAYRGARRQAARVAGLDWRALPRTSISVMKEIEVLDPKTRKPIMVKVKRTTIFVGE